MIEPVVKIKLIIITLNAIYSHDIFYFTNTYKNLNAANPN